MQENFYREYKNHGKTLVIEWMLIVKYTKNYSTKTWDQRKTVTGPLEEQAGELILRKPKYLKDGENILKTF